MVTNAEPDEASGRMDRRQAVAPPSYDVHAAGDDDRNYYLWGAMGGAALVGLGIALAQPDRHVMVITGDGEQLMALGSLATIAVAAPPNLDIWVLDNEHYGETGMQASHTGQGINLAAMAGAAGFTTALMSTLDDLDAVLERTPPVGPARPGFYVLKIAIDAPPRSLPVRDAVQIKNRFRAHLGHPPN